MVYHILVHGRPCVWVRYFAYPEWSGGMYVTPTIAGSRPGGLTAAAWASLAALGMEGFETRTRDILKCTKEIAKGVAAMPELYLMGEANAMIVCFDSKKFNIHRVGDQMTKKGWSLNSLQNPDCIHICCTVKTVGNEKKFLTDLKDSVAHVMAHLDDKVSWSAGIVCTCELCVLWRQSHARDILPRVLCVCVWC